MSRKVQLPNSSRLYIPSMYSEIIDQVQRELALSIGGYTVTEGEGGYYAEGGIIHDHVLIIEVFHDYRLKGDVQRIFANAAEALTLAGEDSVLSVVSGLAELTFAETELA